MISEEYDGDEHTVKKVRMTMSATYFDPLEPGVH